MNKSSGRYDITVSEFEERRHVFEMWRWINTKLSDMMELDDFDTIYFERKGKNLKKLLEEAVPLAYLGLRLFRAFHDVYIQCKAGNQSYDAILEVVNAENTTSIKVEVTITEDEVSTMRRQALSRVGHSFLTGPIRREGRNIISECEMVDWLVEEEKWVELAFDRFLSKVDSQRYDKETAILVCIDSYRKWSFDSRKELIRRTFKHLLSKNIETPGIYYCHLRDATIDEVSKSSRWCL